MTPTMTRRTARHAAVLALGATALCGCASAPTRFFTLDAVAPSATPAAGYAGPAVRVLAVHIPPELDRTELVGEVAPGEMKVHDFEHWEAPLGLTARQVLTQDLAARLPAGAVLGPSTPGGPGTAALAVEVVSFRVSGGMATMQASWSLVRPAPAKGAPPPVFSAPLTQLQAPVAAADGTGTAEGFSALLGQLSDRIAASLASGGAA